MTGSSYDIEYILFTSSPSGHLRDMTHLSLFISLSFVNHTVTITRVTMLVLFMNEKISTSANGSVYLNDDLNFY